MASGDATADISNHLRRGAHVRPTHRRSSDDFGPRRLEASREALNRLASDQSRRATDLITKRKKLIELKLTDSGGDEAHYLKLISSDQGRRMSQRQDQLMSQDMRDGLKGRQYLDGARSRQRSKGAQFFSLSRRQLPNRLQHRGVVSGRTTIGKVAKTRDVRQTRTKIEGTIVANA